MNLNPYIISEKAVDILRTFKPQIDSIINDYETGKVLNCLLGIRPTVPSSLFPTFEIETQDVSTEWATTRGQRHNVNFKCLVTISCSKIEFREEYMTKLTSCIVSIFMNPQNMNFKLTALTPLTKQPFTLAVYDTMVNSVSYSTREGTIGTGEFIWTARVHESIPDVNFTAVPSQTGGIVQPVVKEVN